MVMYTHLMCVDHICDEIVNLEVNKNVKKYYLKLTIFNSGWWISRKKLREKSMHISNNELAGNQRTGCRNYRMV